MRSTLPKRPPMSKQDRRKRQQLSQRVSLTFEEEGVKVVDRALELAKRQVHQRLSLTPTIVTVFVQMMCCSYAIVLTWSSPPLTDGVSWNEPSSEVCELINASYLASYCEPHPSLYGAAGTPQG